METPTNNDPVTELPTESVPSIDLSLDDIIAGLDAGVDYLPIVAIHAAREKREVIIPRLIEAIRRATAAARAGHSPGGQAHFFALFLLTEFKAKEAWPAIQEAISLPGELPFDLFGDAITSSLACVLAAMIGDRHDALDELIRNRELNEYVRWEATETYSQLVLEGRLTREEAVRRLQMHLREAIEREDCDIAGPLVGALTDLIGREALEEIETAFHMKLVDEEIISRSFVERELAADVSRHLKNLKRYGRGPIDDAIAELEGWSCFSESDEEELDDDSISDDERREYEALWRSQTSLFTPLVPRPRMEDSPVMPADHGEVGTVRHTSSRVGRNDPCPCGSGKKFKKCCGAPR